MTETLTPIEILKSRQNFSDYIETHSGEITTELLKDYPARELLIICSQLTQSSDGLITLANQLQGNKKAYIFWFVVNEKEEFKNIAQNLNSFFDKNYCGIFLIKAFLNGDKSGLRAEGESGSVPVYREQPRIDFECLLKPEIPARQIRKTDTPAKTLQLEYWTKYFEICDQLQSEMQVNPKPQHFQYIPIGKAGVQILQTVNTQNKYVATEIMINNKKEIFEKLSAHKAEIEEKLGKLEWYSQDNVKSSRIRKYLNYDITNPEEVENAIRNHIKAAEEFKGIFKKYL